MTLISVTKIYSLGVSPVIRYAHKLYIFFHDLIYSIVFLTSMQTTAQCSTLKNELNTIYLLLCVSMSESSDRNSEMMKQEVTRLQEILNRLDFKRKVCICSIMQSSDM